MATKPNSSVPGSMLEGMQMILGELGGLMATPDADVQFLTTLQHAIVGKIKQSTQHAIGQQGPGGMPHSPGAGGGGGGTGGLVNQQQLQAASQGGMAGVAGPSAQEQGPSGMANMNEMGRVLGTGVTQ